MDIKRIINQMTLEEKAGICSGGDFWSTKGIERLGLPKMMFSDGPYGLHKNSSDSNLESYIHAVCFPAACTTAASFDRDLIYKVGEALGNECQSENVGVILGPAANIKRSPLCGRNFEYYSEDPYLASELAASQIKGIQSKNVGACIKHFWANNQEHRRMTSSSDMDERTAREIYLAAFEGAVKLGKPWTVMCSYNRINGVYSAENKKYLTDVLRKEWGFDGFVVSDWGAVNDRVSDLKAGLELEMPTSFGMNDQKIVEAVKTGELDEAVLDKAVERIINIVYRFIENRDCNAIFDREADHELARKAASESIVLLKNENILPLSKKDTAAFIGYFAKWPRYQGGGSSRINSYKMESAIDMAKDIDLIYAQGYEVHDDIIRQDLIDEAVEAAKRAKVAVVFAGLPDAFESEGFDRTHIRLPQCQNALIKAVTNANPNTVIVLHNGSPVEMPWINDVNAVLEVYLGGQAIGGATIQVLYGEVNPSGRLAETFPLRVQDNPSYLYYLGEGDCVEYREGVFVGYRYYDKKEMGVLFPFGYGLSYTAFSYSNLKLDKTKMKDLDTLTVMVDVTNIGKCAGKEVVQLYVAPKCGQAIRPVRELKGFEKIFLEPNETKTVTFTLSKRAFAYYDMNIQDWYVESGEYEIQINKSSRKIILSASVHITGTVHKKIIYTRDSTIGDILHHPNGSSILKPILDKYSLTGYGEEDNLLGDGTKVMMEALIKNMPLRGLISFSDGSITFKNIEKVLKELNSI